MDKQEYWYFRFTQNFFIDEGIRNMKHLPLGIGYKYIVIYLELCNLSLQNGGFITVEKTVSESIYSMALARDIGEDAETVAEAMTYYLCHNLVEVFEEINATTVFMKKVENNIGKSSIRADKERARINNRINQKLDSHKENIVEQIPAPEVIEIPLEDKKAYGIKENVYITEKEYQSLAEKYLNTRNLIENYSLYKFSNGLENENDYEELVKLMEREGRVRRKK